MFTYPPKPWVDGQVHQVVTEDGHYITGVYDISSNTWNLHHGTSGGHAGGLVMTTDVKTINTPPDKPIPTGTRITYPNINTQLDANWALQKQIDDLRALTTSVWIGNSLEEPPLGQDQDIIYYLWYQTDNEILLHYSVQQQRYVPIEGEGSAQIAFASIAPEFPSPFNAWFNVLSKEMHLAYNSQWWPISRNEDVTYLLAEYAKKVIFSDTAPTTGRLGEELQQGDFWWDTDALELLVNYNDQWFPVAIPPRQLEILRQELDQLYTYTSNNRIGIFDLQQETEGRLQSLEDQLEDIKPSLERGSWSHSMDTISGFTTGKYNLYVKHSDEYCQTKQLKCISDAAGDVEAINKCNRDFVTCGETSFTILDTWEDCNQIYINNIDDAGVSHGWDGVEPDEYLEIVNEDGSGFALYKVTSVADNATAYSLFDLAFVQGEGAPNGLAKFKLFSMLEADPTDFVKKAGDTMTGDLRIKPGTLKVLKIDSGENSNININRNGEGKIVVGKEEVKFDVPIRLGTSIHTDPFQAATVKFAQQVSGRKFVYRNHGDPEKLEKGEFTYAVNQDSGSPGDYIYISDHDVYNQSITTNGSFTISENTYVRIYSTSPHAGLVGFIRASKIEFGGVAADGKYNTFTKSKTYRTPSGHTDGNEYYISDTIAYP